MDELKPCPFCGSVGILVFEVDARTNWYTVTCDECGAAVTQGPGRDAAIKWWNSRPVEGEALDALDAALAHRESINQEKNALLAEVERLRALIAQVEWVDGDWVMFCPWCNGQQNFGHKDDCPIKPND